MKRLLPTLLFGCFTLAAWAADDCNCDAVLRDGVYNYRAIRGSGPGCEQNTRSTSESGIPRKLTCPECERRAKFAPAFKWIPEEEFEKVRGQAGNLSTVTCKTALCLGYCSETLCWCVGGLCKPME